MNSRSITQDAYQEAFFAEANKHPALLDKIFNTVLDNRKKFASKTTKDEASSTEDEISPTADLTIKAILTQQFHSNIVDTYTDAINNILQNLDTTPNDPNLWPLIALYLTVHSISYDSNNTTLLRRLAEHKGDLLNAVKGSPEIQTILHYHANPTFQHKHQHYTYSFTIPLFYTLSYNKTALTSNTPLSICHQKPPFTNSAKELLHLMGWTTDYLSLENDNPLYQLAMSDAPFETQVNTLLNNKDITPVELIKDCVKLGKDPKTLGNFILSTNLLAAFLAHHPQSDHKLNKQTLNSLAQKECKRQFVFAIKQHLDFFKPLLNTNSLLDAVIDHQKFTPSLFKKASKTRNKLTALMHSPAGPGHPLPLLK